MRCIEKLVSSSVVSQSTLSQGADSCELVDFCGLLNQTEKKRTDWTETGQEKVVIFRRGTRSLSQIFLRKTDKTDKNGQSFSGGIRTLSERKNGQKRPKITKNREK